MASDIRPYTISVPDSSLTSLSNKLSSSTFPDQVDFSDSWDYGAPRSDVKRLVEYWKDGFDWKTQESRLNQIPQFITPIHIDGHGDLDIHFVHQKSPRPDSIPLLFCHGWPGSFLEVVKILPLLTDTEDGPSFHVVAPSLPNFGFSDAPKQKGFSIPQYAETCHKLMMKLGYTSYATQGGDWGFIITRLMAVLYPQNCLATHVNFVRVTKPPSLTTSPWQYIKHAILAYDPKEEAGRERTKWFLDQGFGYNIEQSTKPSTLGFALADSPVALLSWIYEKLHDWTDNYPWTDDEILTWISIYQFSTAGPAASLRIYYESAHAKTEITKKGFGYIPNIPIGLSYFPEDLIVPPMTWGRTLGPVVFEEYHDSGGHFAAYERPEVLVRDLRKMFGKGGGVVSTVGRLISKL